MRSEPRKNSSPTDTESVEGKEVASRSQRAKTISSTLPSLPMKKSVRSVFPLGFPAFLSGAGSLHLLISRVILDFRVVGSRRSEAKGREKEFERENIVRCRGLLGQHRSNQHRARDMFLVSSVLLALLSIASKLA